jgi:WD40 repeat protein
LDAKTGEVLFTLSGEPDTAVYRVSINPDGTRIATVGSDNIIRVWDTATGKVVLSFNGHGEGNSGGMFTGTIDVDYSPDGSRFATAGTDGVAKVWDAETGQLLLTLDSQTNGLHSLLYSPNGSLLATTVDEPDSSVRVWNAETGELIHRLEGHPSRAWGLVFTSDNGILVSSGMGGIVKVWDLTTGKEMYTLPGQSRTVSSLVITPDDKKLITSGDAVRILDLESGAELLTLTPYRARMALTNDGKHLYVGVSYQFIGLYPLSLEDLMSLAEVRLTRWFTEDECQKYLHVEVCPSKQDIP